MAHLFLLIYAVRTENTLFLLWRHLEYYIVQQSAAAGTNDSLVLDRANMLSSASTARSSGDRDRLRTAARSSLLDPLARLREIRRLPLSRPAHSSSTGLEFIHNLARRIVDVLR